MLDEIVRMFSNSGRKYHDRFLREAEDYRRRAVPQKKTSERIA